MTGSEPPRTPDAWAGPWAHPPRKPRRSALSGAGLVLVAAALICVAVAAALGLRVL